MSYLHLFAPLRPRSATPPLFHLSTPPDWSGSHAVPRPPYRFFETFSYLPPLSDAELLKQVQYLISNKYNPCIEFEFPDKAYAAAAFEKGFDSRSSSGFSINRYWSMWKLPMYGATDPEMVLAECKKCSKAFPNAFVRLAGFDAVRQARVPARRPRPAAPSRRRSLVRKPSVLARTRGFRRSRVLA